MQKQTALYIPKPCHEDWNKMTPVQQGKFCSACSKQVIDFSLMSDNQILNYLSNQSGKVCGRFDAEQLERTLIETKIKKKKGWWMAAFMPLFLINNKYHDKNIIISKTDTTIQPFEKELVTMGVILEEVSMPVNIKGKVLDEIGAPLPYVTITEKGTQSKTVTDSAGNFSINIQPNTDSISLIASYVGYETVEKTFSVNNIDNIYVDIRLDQYITKGLTEVVMGKIAYGKPGTSIDTVKTAIKKICGISGFKIYPNPVVQNSVVHLEIKQAGEYQLHLIDNQSRLITIDNINAVANKSVSNFTLPSNIVAGIYYLRLINEQTKKSYTEKLIIR